MSELFKPEHRQHFDTMRPRLILHHELQEYEGRFVDGMYFDPPRGGALMRHLERKYFNLLLAYNHYRDSVQTASRLPAIRIALGAVFKRLEVERGMATD